MGALSSNVKALTQVFLCWLAGRDPALQAPANDNWRLDYAD